MTTIKYINSFDPKTNNICGLGVIGGKEYEFYLDGDADEICVDVHKHWISDNDEAWDGEKSAIFTSFESCVKYINKLFNADIRKIRPIGFNEDAMKEYLNDKEINNEK